MGEQVQVLQFPPASASAEFDAFWRAYPRRKAKADARKAWAQTAAVRPPLVELLQAVRRACAGDDWRRDGGRYIPYPATWLRGERWTDEDDVPLAQEPDQVEQQWLALREHVRGGTAPAGILGRVAAELGGVHRLGEQRSVDLDRMLPQFRAAWHRVVGDGSQTQPRATVHSLPRRRA